MRFGLVIKEAFQGLSRNASMVVSVVLVTFISLTFVGVAILLQGQITAMKSYWDDKAQVQLYFCVPTDKTGNCVQAAATEEEIAAVRGALDAPPLSSYVDRSEFLTAEDVYRETSALYADTAVGEFLTAEAVPPIIRVTLLNPSDADVIIESLGGYAGVESVEDLRGYLEPIFAILSASSAAAIGVAVLMLVAAVLLIATTIRLSAFSRRRELAIMRLVGASNRFIETPFVLEGVIAALIGSILSGAALVAIAQFFVRGQVGSLLGNTGLLVGVDDAVKIVPLILIIGVVLAALSASVAIKRYLRA